MLITQSQLDKGMLNQPFAPLEVAHITPRGPLVVDDLPVRLSDTGYTVQDYANNLVIIVGGRSRWV